MILFLTSSPTGPLDNSRYVDGIDGKNYLIENFQKYWKKNAKCLYITAMPDNYTLNDEIRSGMKATWEKADFQSVHLISGMIEQQIFLKKHYILMM